MERSFHGRTLGALSLTNTAKKQQKESFLTIPTERLPYTKQAGEAFQNILTRYKPYDIACVIMEPIQGEGGYNIPNTSMVQEIRKITKECNIPLVSDEVQTGMGRTGEWWGIQNFNVQPDVIAIGKALQVGATIANKEMFPTEPGSISSTWGGGHRLDLAIGLQTIHTIKKKHLLTNVKKQGKYLLKRLQELSKENKSINNPRGYGLMTAIDVSTNKMRNDIVIEAAKHGLIILGCGLTGIRLIPPYIITEKEIDEALIILEKAINICSRKNFQHKGKICGFMDCGENHT